MSRDVISLPHDGRAEVYVLGTALGRASALEKVLSLQKGDFYVVAHQLIFAAMKVVFERDESVDFVRVAEVLKRKDQLTVAGDYDYLSGVVMQAGIGADINAYIDILKSLSRRRKAIEISREIEKMALEMEDDKSMLDWSMKSLLEVRSSMPERPGKLVREILDGQHGDKPFLGELERKYALHAMGEEQEADGVQTGFYDLDRLLDGLGNSNFVVLAARPAMGKTALALNVADYVAKHYGHVAIFSLEMSGAQLVERLLSFNSGVNVQRLRRGAISEQELGLLRKADGEVGRARIIIDDNGAVTAGEIVARCRALHQRFGLSLVVIDYLQLLDGSRKAKADNRVGEISEITRELKKLAVELNRPILALSQLSRATEQRSSHKPQLSDLRESGSIEQDADAVVFIVRPEVYTPNKKPGVAEISIAKNRHGPTGECILTFIGKTGRFENFSNNKPGYEYET